MEHFCFRQLKIIPIHVLDLNMYKNNQTSYKKTFEKKTLPSRKDHRKTRDSQKEHSGSVKGTLDIRQQVYSK